MTAYTSESIPARLVQVFSEVYVSGGWYGGEWHEVQEVRVTASGHIDLGLGDSVRMGPLRPETKVMVRKKLPDTLIPMPP